LQRICSAARRAIDATTIAVSSCGGIEVGFDFHRSMSRFHRIYLNAMRDGIVMLLVAANSLSSARA
jgi:hypothetical protein